MEHSYHGDTIGTMSVGERGVFNQAYAPLLYDVETIPFPTAGAEHLTVQALESLTVQHPGEIAALIVEPMVLGAGGMKMYEASVLKALKTVCEAHDVVFIADEVMTGWGRTGTLFACEHADIVPDILCTSKGLTGGLLPLAATLCGQKFFDAHYSPDRSKMFFHSSSYTANPIACAVACANVQIWADPCVLGNVQNLVKAQAQHLSQIKSHQRYENIRQCGTITALDVKVGDQGYMSDIAPKLYNYFQGMDVLLRPLGNTVYILPPYCLTENDLDKIYHAVSQAPDILGL